MKIETTTSSHMLYKGAAENTQKLIKGQEAERLKAALNTDNKSSSPLDNRGVKFDAKA